MAYTSLDPASLNAQDLEWYGEAAWWSGKLNDAVRLRERAYVAYTGEGWGGKGWAVIAAWSAVFAVLAMKAYQRDTKRA